MYQTELKRYIQRIEECDDLIEALKFKDPINVTTLSQPMRDALYEFAIKRRLGICALVNEQGVPLRLSEKA